MENKQQQEDKRARKIWDPLSQKERTDLLVRYYKKINSIDDVSREYIEKWFDNMDYYAKINTILMGAGECS